MEAARRPRSGLRSRRPSSGGGGRGGPLPGDGGECARPWAELLRAGSADLSPDGELPSLPAFPGPEQLWEATLRSCPMCQANFAPSLAPLDIDGHLAQCLAESTEDVAW